LPPGIRLAIRVSICRSFFFVFFLSANCYRANDERRETAPNDLRALVVSFKRGTLSKVRWLSRPSALIHVELLGTKEMLTPLPWSMLFFVSEELSNV